MPSDTNAPAMTGDEFLAKELTWENFRTTVGAVPFYNLFIMVETTFKHKMSNECASKIAAARAKHFRELEQAADPTAKTDVIAARVKTRMAAVRDKTLADPLSDEAQEAILAAAEAEMFATITSGKIGRSEAGPRQSPVAIRMKAYAREVLVLRGVKFGKKESDPTNVPDINGIMLDGATLLARFVEKNKVEYQKRIDAERKAAERDAAKYKTDGGLSVAGLGI